jgi:hypothetical protein
MIKYSETLVRSEEKPESGEAQFTSFIKTWRTVLNILLEEDLTDSCKEQIKVI